MRKNVTIFHAKNIKLLKSRQQYYIIMFSPSVVARIKSVLAEKLHNFRSWEGGGGSPGSPARMPMLFKVNRSSFVSDKIGATLNLEAGIRNRKPELETGIGNRNRKPKSGNRNPESTNQRKQVLQSGENYFA